MEIPLFESDAPLKFERIVLYPYPDLKRIWTRCWITAVQDKQPNLELRVLDENGMEDNSTFVMGLDSQRFETTLHMRNPVPGGHYRVTAELTVGMGEELELVDKQDFELILEFRDAEANEPGFGFGVEWDKT